MGNKDKYITLKEASKISGYSSDYIGQLIRKGKLPGKQVFSNVAWMTTEKAIRRYAKEKKGKGSKRRWFLEMKRRFLAKDNLSKLYQASLYIVVVFVVIFSLFLFYILAVGIDKKLEERSLERTRVSGEQSI